MRKPHLGTVLLTLWGLVLVVALATYLQYLQPARLGRTVADLLEQHTVLSYHMDAAELQFFPKPAVRLLGLKVSLPEQPNLSLRAAECSLELSWLSLFKLKPV